MFCGVNPSLFLRRRADLLVRLSVAHCPLNHPGRRACLLSTNQPRHQSNWQERVRESVNVPNTLTVIRLVSTPGLAYLIWTDQYVFAIGACFASGILDWFDGYLARKWNQYTVLGSYLDPLADKVFIGALLGTLTLKGLFPVPLAALVIGRDAALLGGSFLYRYLTKPSDVRFFATTGEGVMEVKPTTASKVNTVLQMSIMGFALTKAAFGVPDQPSFDAMCWVVGGTTVLSGLSYINLHAFRIGSRIK